jgi:proteasome accessory factor A
MFTGSGHLTNNGRVLSQRALVIENVHDLTSTCSRPMVYWRNEHYSEGGIRMHVLCGDSNMSDWSTYLKVGTTNILISMESEGKLLLTPKLEDPVKAMRNMNHDLTLKKRLTRHGWKRGVRPLYYQQTFHDLAGQYIEEINGSEDDRKVIEVWGEAIKLIQRRSGGKNLDRHCDCWIKFSGMQGELAHQKKLNLDFHNIFQSAPYYACRGHFENLVNDADIAACAHPPRSRAYLRQEQIEFLRRKHEITYIDWDMLLYREGQASVEIKFPEPYLE